ncbi:AAA-like domain-containing protein [Parafrankia irregularis]|uniref:AAA-like domain-containing protein n=1 Tax=Parafrankia irregularis TaxID=795642 RepID=A0A0S4QLW9_9ACTN|nr:MULTISPECIES: ATP-binding protein [Parafrankia]CUU56593.1 AAA-like domain-containing protein [Parafrankia irregularis]
MTGVGRRHQRHRAGARRPLSLPRTNRALLPAHLRDRRLTLPRDLATTAHLCSAYPFTVEADTGATGAFLGANRLAGGGFFFDLHDAYAAGLLHGPNMVICGAGAYGKSAIAKTYVYRSTALTPNRFVAVIDPKGEWTALGTALGWSSLRLRPGGDLIVNPFDRGPAQHTLTVTELLAQRVTVANTLFAIALARTELAAGEQRLLHEALRHLASTIPASAASPTLTDLRHLLADPPAALATALDTTPADLAERRRPLLDACAMLVEHDLRGICDTATSVDLGWTDSPGLVLDLSALLTRRRTLKLVLAAAAGWLQGVMYQQPDRPKLVILDEGWIALEDLAITRFLQDQWRLGRQWGTANILITHALADLSSQVDDGAAAGKIAEGLLTTTSARVFMHQNPNRRAGSWPTSASPAPRPPCCATSTHSRPCGRSEAGQP